MHDLRTQAASYVMRTSIQKTTLGNAYEFELIAQGPGKIELVDMFGRVYYQHAWTDSGHSHQTGRMIDPDRRHGLEFRLTGCEFKPKGRPATTVFLDDVIDVDSTEVKGEINP
jgi:hypothetical protein